MTAISLKNADAYRTLAARYMDDLFFLAQRILRDKAEAEDVVQNVFMLIWEQPKKWQADKGRLKAWLWTITSNACRDVLRKSSRIVYSDGNFDEIAHHDAAPDQKAEYADQLHNVLEQISTLPERQQTALYLFVYDELSHQEIADLMEISADAVESLIARARKSLRKNVKPTQKIRKNIGKNIRIGSQKIREKIRIGAQSHVRTH